MNTLKKVWTYFVISVVAMICALNYELFVFPNRFAPAGLNGICTMIQYITGISVGFMSLVINIPLALLVFFKVDKPQAIRSMVYVGVNSVMLMLLERVNMDQFAYFTENGTSTILGPLVAGIIFGACYMLLVQCRAGSGGTDFIAALIHRSNPGKNVFWLIFALNVAVALVSYFVYDFQIEPVILCIIYCFTSSTVTDKMAKNTRSAVRFEIITEEPEVISSAIIEKLHHSATLIPGKGMYLGKEVSVLVGVVNRTQAATLSAIIRDCPNTFAVMSQVGEVMGNFKRIDNRGNQEKQLLDQG